MLIISQDNLEATIKELLRDLESKQYTNALSDNVDHTLDTTVQVLNLCADQLREGTYEQGYEDGYSCCSKESGEDDYDEGWNDCKEAIINLLLENDVNIKSIPYLEDL